MASGLHELHNGVKVFRKVFHSFYGNGVSWSKILKVRQNQKQLERAIDSPKKQTNEFVLFAMKSKKASKTNLFVHFLGESAVRQSAFGFIWPLVITFIPLLCKGQLISKANYGLLTSPKKRMNEFVLFAMKSKKANKTNLLTCFLEKSTARQSVFGFIWPLVRH